MKYYVQIGKVFNRSEIKYEILCELQIGDYVEMRDGQSAVVESRHYCIKDGYMVFLVKSLNELDLPPLIENHGINKYTIDYKRLTSDQRNKLFFDFFNINIGKTVEVNLIWGACNSILSKSTFVIGGEIWEDLIEPNEIFEKDYCYNYFKYSSIYGAKIIN